MIATANWMAKAEGVHMGWPEDVAELAKNAKQAAEEAIRYAESMDMFDDWVPFSGPTEEDRQQPQVIHDRIMVFATPRDGAGITDMYNLLKEAKTLVTQNMEDSLDEARHLMTAGEWTGLAADGFNTLLSQMKDAGHNQENILADLAAVTDAYRQLVRSMQADLGDVVRAGIIALNDRGIDAKEVGEAISGAPLENVGSGNVTGALTDLTVDLAGVLFWEIASNELEALHAFSDALHKLRGLVDAQIKNVGRAYDVLIDHVSNKLPTIQPGRPGIITQPAFNPDEFAVDEPEFQNNKSTIPTGGLVPLPQVTGLGTP